jgi:hypothetical protein
MEKLIILTGFLILCLMGLLSIYMDDHTPKPLTGNIEIGHNDFLYFEDGKLMSEKKLK